VRRVHWHERAQVIRTAPCAGNDDEGHVRAMRLSGAGRDRGVAELGRQTGEGRAGKSLRGRRSEHSKCGILDSFGHCLLLRGAGFPLV